MPGHNFCNLIGAVLAASFLAEPALAITTTGDITAHILDPTGLPLKGAKVSVHSPNLIGPAHEGVTDTEGLVRFSWLSAGTYAVTVRADGFRDMRVDGMLVLVGQSNPLEVVMDPWVATLPGPRVLNAPVQAVEPERVHLGGTIHPSFTNYVPTTRDHLALALVFPGTQDLQATVSGDNTAVGNPLIHGADPHGNLYLLDGFNVTDPVTGTHTRGVNFDAIEQAQVMTGAWSAEYGGATGGVINVVTRSGGNVFHSDASLYVSPDLGAPQRSGLTSRNKLAALAYAPLHQSGEIPGPQQGALLNLNLGGPILHDRLWFFMSHQLTYSLFSTSPGVFEDVGMRPPREVRGYLGLGKLTWQVTPRQRVEMVFQGDPVQVANRLQLPTVHPDAEERLDEGGSLIGLSSLTNLRTNVVLHNRLSFTTGYHQVVPQSGDLETPSRVNELVGTVMDNARTVHRDTRSRIQYSPQLDVEWNGLGSHRTKLGMDAWFAWARVEDRITAGRYVVESGIPARAGMPVTPSREVRLMQAQREAVNGDSMGLYVQEEWKPVSRLTIRPGLRLDSTRLRSAEAADARALLAQPGTAVERFLDATVVQLNAVSPRLAVAWDPFNSAKTNLHMGYFRHTQTGSLMVPLAMGRRHERHLGFNPATGAYDILLYDVGGRGGATADPELSGFNPMHLPGREDLDLSQPLAPTIQGWDPLQIITGHHVPKVDEVVVGVARELVPGVVLSVDAVGRRFSNLFEDEETNVRWNVAGSDAMGFRNEQPQLVNVLGTPDEARRTYVGLDFMLRKHLTHRFEGVVSYSLGMAQGTTNAPLSVTFDRSPQRPFLDGFLEYDRRHILRALGYFHLPLNLVVGGNISFLSGIPYNRFQHNLLLADWRNLAALRGHDPTHLTRELRMPNLVQTGLRVVWSVPRLLGPEFWFIANVDNVLNLREPTDLEQRDLPEGSPTEFEDVLQRQAPVLVTLGLRIQH